MSNASAPTETAEGMGAIPMKEGVFFRTWAPHADNVAVMGSFNDWSKTGNSLEPEENGFWGTYVQKAKPGDEYKFVITNGEEVLEKNDPYARKLTNSSGNSIIYKDEFDWGDDAFETPPLNDLVIYELHVGSFNPTEEGNPGTFGSIIEKLDYIQSLGINAIELMPVGEFPGGFSWGYNHSYPYAVESDYGGPDELKRLVKEAHARGIAIILDVVYNHFGPSDLDMWRFDGWGENDGGGIYFFNDWRSQTPWGHTRPDYGREEVRRYIIDNAMMWLSEFRMDGLRWDATCYISSSDGNCDSRNLPEGWELMRQATAEIRQRFPGKLLFAEDLKDDPDVTKPLEEGGAGFHSQWDSKFVHPIRNELIMLNDDDRSVELVADSIRHRFNDDAFQRVIFTESHDETANGEQRLPEEISAGNVGDWFAMKRSMLGALLVMTAPGVPMILQGQEFLEDEWFRDNDPLEWRRTKKYKGVVSYYTDLIHLRRDLKGVSGGLKGSYLQVFHCNQGDKVIAWQRASAADSEDQVVVVANFANRNYENYRIGFPKPGKWFVRLNSDSQHYNKDFGNLNATGIEVEEQEYDGMPYSAGISVGPYTALIYSR